MGCKQPTWLTKSCSSHCFAPIPHRRAPHTASTQPLPPLLVPPLQLGFSLLLTGLEDPGCEEIRWEGREKQISRQLNALRKSSRLNEAGKGS